MTEARSYILDMAEDDFTGLWEVLWGLQSAPLGLSQAEAFTEAQKQIADLLESGLIEMYRGKAFSGDEDVLPRAQALAICSQKEQWSPPAADAEHCRILRKV